MESWPYFSFIFGLGKRHEAALPDRAPTVEAPAVNPGGNPLQGPVKPFQAACQPLPTHLFLFPVHETSSSVCAVGLDPVVIARESHPFPRIVACLGPTNSGKTHYGLSRLAEAESGRQASRDRDPELRDVRLVHRHDPLLPRPDCSLRSAHLICRTSSIASGRARNQ